MIEATQYNCCKYCSLKQVLSDDFDAFVNKQKQLNVKHTNFEVRNHLYDLEWNHYKVDE